MTKLSEDYESSALYMTTKNIGTLLKSYNLKGNMGDMVKFISDMDALVKEEKKKSYAEGFTAALDLNMNTIL